jgi:hypothetical protein
MTMEMEKKAQIQKTQQERIHSLWELFWYMKQSKKKGSGQN